MPTRHAQPGSDPNASPERYLASSKIRGINIGLNIVCRIGRAHPIDTARALIWLTNYSLLKRTTADQLSELLDLDKAEIREALTNPDADASRVVKRVDVFRSEFQSGLSELVPTSTFQTTSEAFNMAVKRRVIAEVNGPNRSGKTQAAEYHFLRNLDRCIWVDCPHDEIDRSFYWAFARALGVNFGAGKKTAQIVPQLTETFATGLIDLIIVDEAQDIWPSRLELKPKRVEFLRSIHDLKPHGVSLLLLSTIQAADALREALQVNTRWAPGQWQGRRIPYHLPDFMPHRDLIAVAKHYAPDWSPAMLEVIVDAAASSDGLLGFMVHTIELAHDKAEIRGSKVTGEIVVEAVEQMIHRTNIAEAVDGNQTATRKPKRRAA